MKGFESGDMARNDRADLFDTAQIPDDPQHWDALAARVAAATAPRFERSGFDWLANSRASWVATSVLTAIALTVVILAADGSAAGISKEWAQALAPADDIGKAIIVREGSPAIGSLLLATSSRGVR
jgi:hypothetical protein